MDARPLSWGESVTLPLHGGQKENKKADTVAVRQRRKETHDSVSSEPDSVSSLSLSPFLLLFLLF